MNVNANKNLDELILNYQKQLEQTIPKCAYTHEKLNTPVILFPCLHSINLVAFNGFKEILERAQQKVICPVDNCGKLVAEYKVDTFRDIKSKELDFINRKIAHLANQHAVKKPVNPPVVVAPKPKQNPVQPVVAKPNLPVVKPAPVVDPYPQQVVQLGRNLGISLSQSQQASLNHLMAKMGSRNMIQFLQSITLVDKPKMFNTLIDVGQNLISVPHIHVERNWSYVKKKRGNTFAFAINDKEILIVQKFINKGGFKKVNETLNLLTLKADRVRLVSKGSAAKPLIEEEELLQKLHRTGNPYIVPPFSCKFIDNAIHPRKVVMFHFRYDGDGSTLQNSTIKIAQKLRAFKEVALGLAHMNKDGYIHLDMKPYNFLIKGNPMSANYIQARVSDFGITVIKGAHISGWGTQPYWSPEQFQYAYGGLRANEKIDSFNLGITMLEILLGPDLLRNYKTHLRLAGYTGQFTQRDMNNIFKLFMEDTNKNPQLDLANRQVFAEVSQVTLELLAIDANQRITCAQAGQKLRAIEQKHYPR